MDMCSRLFFIGMFLTLLNTYNADKAKLKHPSITWYKALAQNYYEETDEQPPSAPPRFNTRIEKSPPVLAYFGKRVRVGATRFTRQPKRKIPQPNGGFSPITPTTIKWWESQHTFKEKAPTQNVPYLSSWAFQLYDHEYATWISRCMVDGWPSFSQAPSCRRCKRTSPLVQGSTQDLAFQKCLRWLNQQNFIEVLDLPELPATQTMTPGAAIKTDYDGNWKARATVNGGPHLHSTPNTRAEYINRKEIAYSNQPIIEMIAAILAHDLRWATITDYKKFFLYLKHLFCEVASNCIYYRGKFIYCRGKTFGARGTPFAADCFGKLLQDIYQSQLNEELAATTKIFRRTDDQAVLTHSQAEAKQAADIFVTITSTARVPVQHDKTLIAVQIFRFDGYLWDLKNKRIGIPQDKRRFICTTVAKLLKKCNRKQCERFQGLLEWITIVLYQLRTHTVDFRANWMSTPSDAAPVTLSLPSTIALERFATLAEKDELWVSMKHFFESKADITITTDGSGRGGMGGFTSTKHFFSYNLPKDKFDQHATALDGTNSKTHLMSSTWIEVAALWLAIRTFDLKGKCVEWWTDSEAATKAWNNNKSECVPINFLLTQIHFFCANNDISIQARWHERESPNAKLADELSKDDISSFPQQASTRHYVPQQALRAVDKSVGILHQKSPTPVSQQKHMFE